ncbi:MAG: peptidylprolyl isomerase A [Desulfovibrionales bacterium]|jgi:peptidyl-prolyl cis-trans isomerase A (cyclophilin A)/peptidyl-prolyl cis-trans isomerase B (cyclophilin B)|nr:peptidylprolyl isomerase A [Desulfovibrionales bacterium]
MRGMFIFLVFVLLTTPVWAANPQVALTTNKGVIVLELDPQKAPVTVANFLQYVKEGFYTDTIFHRVIKGFMIQGGGMEATLTPKKGRGPIKNEADNGLKNDKYTVAMARTADINSATSQFFINTADNNFLNHGSRDFGYAVFGWVVRGQDVVDAIEAVSTGSLAMHGDVPKETIVIEQAEVLPVQ